MEKMPTYAFYVTQTALYAKLIDTKKNFCYYKNHDYIQFEITRKQVVCVLLNKNIFIQEDANYIAI